MAALRNCGEAQRTRDDPAGELDLEGVVAGGFCIRERNRCRRGECRVLRFRAGERSFRRLGAPRFCGNPAERDARLGYEAVLEPQRRRA